MKNKMLTALFVVLFFPNYSYGYSGQHGQHSGHELIVRHIISQEPQSTVEYNAASEEEARVEEMIHAAHESPLNDLSDWKFSDL